MTAKLAPLLAALALVAGCEFGKKTTWQGPIAQCRSVGAACTENAECCSYGCEAGLCVPGDHDGTVCRNTDDCGVPTYSFTQMLCKSGHCSSTATCRDSGDVCNFASECCSHHCTGTGGSCVPNHAPVVQLGVATQAVPRNQPWTAVNTSFDPDAGDVLAYGWTLAALPPGTPLPPGASLSSVTARNPVFTPGSALVSYVLTLDVTDNWGLTSSGSVVLDVVNAPPVVTPAVATATVARNGALTVSMDASDANLDTVTCAWSVCRSGGAPCLTAPAAPAPFASTAPQTKSAAFPTGLVATDEGAWDVTLSCGDGALVGAATTTVTVTNTAPAIAVPATRTFNLAFDPLATPTGTVTAVPSDANGDAIASVTWTVGPTANVTLSNATTAAVGFTPTTGGTRVLTVTACDGPAVNPPWVNRPGDCSSADVTVSVHPYVRPVTSGSVVAAAWRKSDDRLVAAGTTGAAADALWLANPAVDPGATADASVALGAAPLALSVSTDGATALVGQATARFQTVSLGTTPAASSLWTGPFDPTGVVHWSANRGYGLRTSAATPVYDLDLGAGSFTAASCTNCTLSGSRAVTDGSTLWILTAGSPGSLAAYSVNNGNGNLTRALTASVSASATDLWRSSDPAYLFLPGTNGIVVAATLNTAGSLPAGSTHADSSLTGASLVGLAATGATVTPFGSAFTAGSPIALPSWGAAGVPRALTAKWAFVSADGTRAHVVVQSTAPIEWGLYSCALPCALP
jgi:hypothetical protein